MDELIRLRGDLIDQQKDGFLVDLEVNLDEPAEDYLSKVKEVLEIVLSNDISKPFDFWVEHLPCWFVERCADEISAEEAKRRLSLPIEEREELAKQWSLSAWLYWFRPEERSWKWWKAEVVSDRKVVICVTVEGHPFPIGSLEWLLKAAGATSMLIDSEESVY